MFKQYSNTCNCNKMCKSFKIQFKPRWRSYKIPLIVVIEMYYYFGVVGVTYAMGSDGVHVDGVAVSMLSGGHCGVHLMALRLAIKTTKVHKENRRAS